MKHPHDFLLPDGCSVDDVEGAKPEREESLYLDENEPENSPRNED